MHFCKKRIFLPPALVPLKVVAQRNGKKGEWQTKRYMRSPGPGYSVFLSCWGKLQGTKAKSPGINLKSSSQKVSSRSAAGSGNRCVSHIPVVPQSTVCMRDSEKERKTGKEGLGIFMLLMHFQFSVTAIAVNTTNMGAEVLLHSKRLIWCNRAHGGAIKHPQQHFSRSPYLPVLLIAD